MRVALIAPFLLVFALGACGEDKKASPDTADTTEGDTSEADTTDTSEADTADTGELDTDAEVTPSLTGCLSDPTALPRPTEMLPCELIPPGLTL